MKNDSHKSKIHLQKYTDFCLKFRQSFSWKLDLSILVDALQTCYTISTKKDKSSIQECRGILAARCASCNCMTYFYCAPLQVYTPFRSAQNHCPPDNVRPAGGYIMQMYNIILLRTSVNLRFFVPNHSIISCTSHSVFLFIHMLLVCCLFFRLHDLY